MTKTRWKGPFPACDSLDALYRALNDDVPLLARLFRSCRAGRRAAQCADHVRWRAAGRSGGSSRPSIRRTRRSASGCVSGASQDFARHMLSDQRRQTLQIPTTRQAAPASDSDGGRCHALSLVSSPRRSGSSAPTIIVALGTTALQALSGRRQALGRVRGSIMAFGEFSFLPTVHPSFLLRFPDARARGHRARKIHPRPAQGRRVGESSLNRIEVVRMVGLEPTRIATADFESAASTISPHPRGGCL